MKTSIAAGQFWTHIKTGGTYFITGFCILESTNKDAVLYINETADDGVTPWARDKEEFLDGRFERLHL